MSENRNLRILWQPEFSQAPSLVVGWSGDVAKLGSRTVGYLKNKLGAREFAEIEPMGFFPLTGVSVKDDVARFPESKFYCSTEHNLVLCESDAPLSGWHNFLNLVLDVAERHCHIKEFYTIGGMIFFGAHTVPRELLAVSTDPAMRDALKDYQVSREMNYETPLGQRPTLSSYLLWAARKRNLMGASLWTPIPFYLIANEDPLACKKVLEFIDERAGLGLDFKDMDSEVSAQAENMARLRTTSAEIDSSIRKLESNQGLTQEENEKLARGVAEFLRKAG